MTMDIHEAEYRFSIKQVLHLISCWTKIPKRGIRICPSSNSFEEQRWSNSCGVHALNNALQEAFQEFYRMKSLATTLDKDQPGKTSYDHRGFSIRVLIKALNDAGHIANIPAELVQIEEYDSVICWSKDGPSHYFAMIWRGNDQVYVLDSVKHAPERLYIWAKSHGQDPMQWTTMDIHEAEYRFQKGVHLILCWIKTATRVIRICPTPIL